MLPRPLLADDPPNAGFERLASFAARLLSAPLCVINLVDGERTYAAGDDGDGWRPRREAPLHRSLCRLPAEAGAPLLLEDARAHPAVRENPSVWLGEIGYAGIPFRRADGRIAGTLAVADARPRAWTAEEADLLDSLARFASLLLPAHDGAASLTHALERAARSARRGVSLRMLRKAVETMQLGVTITGLDGRILYSNPADARMHGYEPGALVGKHARVLAPPSRARGFSGKTLEEASSWSRETVNVRQDGSQFPVLLRSDVVRDAAGRPVALVTCCEDLTHRRHLERELLRTAFYDAVTGEPNRGLLTHRLDLALDRAGEGGDGVALLAVELDRLQLVADGLGRAAAESLLCAAAERLHGCVPAGALVAHVAADQFAVLVEGCRGTREAGRIAAAVRGALSAPFALAGGEVFTGASIGIVVGGDYASAEDALRDAALAMVRAREAGDGHPQLFDPAMHAEAMARLRLETDLRRALERGEMRVHYQPIVALETGRIAGFEALARWEHPERGLLLPDEFVPLAEETGLILPIGLWVLDEACRALRDWRRLPGGADLTMSVNLCARQFAQPDLVGRVAAALEETGVSSAALALEITEGALLQHSTAVAGTLAGLKALGVQLHVDDFGTGYSSLSYLHRLPLDALKIDRSFVLAEGGNLPMVRAIVAMAHALGVAVVTEGIESAPVLRELRALRCEYGQGYLFSRPVPATEARGLWDALPRW